MKEQQEPEQADKKEPTPLTVERAKRLLRLVPKPLAYCRPDNDNAEERR